MKKRNLSGLLVLLIFAVFAISVLMILLSGADIVRRLTGRGQDAYDHRTAVQYLTTRVHQADSAGSVAVGAEEGGDVLILTEEIDGAQYETRVYCYDGYLREMFCSAGAGLPPEFGEKILPMTSFRIALEDSVLSGSFTLTDGSSEAFCLFLRSKGGQ